jgi:poly-gamma-glutamate capsule biosynthesis protein CapA/YwtB (metallophosphatase superfamily)
VVRLFLCGDVMIGRGIDQIQSSSVDPALFEPSVTSAEDYVRLAERANGSIPRPVAPEYVWGAALDEIDAVAPDARIVNLETTLTTSPAAWPRKHVLYRTHPDNVAVLRAGRIDCCVLANNHILDWGYGGLLETLDTLELAGLATVGAGRDRFGAQAPAVIEVAAGRVIVLGLGSTTSGIPPQWGATEDRPGVDLIAGGATGVAGRVAARLSLVRRPGDVVIASVHWGPNWGYGVSLEQRRLAHELVDIGGVDIVHGHSSHHPLGIELYNQRLILHGCGDFITDYEGIAGYEEFRDDLVLAYFPTIDAASGRLLGLSISPFQLRQFRLRRPEPRDVVWLRDTVGRHSRPLGARVELAPDGKLRVHGEPGPSGGQEASSRGAKSRAAELMQ